MKKTALRFEARFAGTQRESGVTLIEILVAIVLLSIGLLGLAGLQLRGLQVNQGSALRSNAAIMAEDLADRMRADLAASAPGGSFYGTYTAASGPTVTLPALTDWLAGLQNMPAGVAVGQNVPCTGNVLPCVQVQALAVASPPTPVEIDVYWNDARAANAATKTPTNQVGSFKVVAEISNQ